jgi:hypothetical protein
MLTIPGWQFAKRVEMHTAPADFSIGVVTDLGPVISPTSLRGPLGRPLSQEQVHPFRSACYRAGKMPGSSTTSLIAFEASLDLLNSA